MGATPGSGPDSPDSWLELTATGYKAAGTRRQVPQQFGDTTIEFVLRCSRGSAMAWRGLPC